MLILTSPCAGKEGRVSCEEGVGEADRCCDSICVRASERPGVHALGQACTDTKGCHQTERALCAGDRAPLRAISTSGILWM